MMGLEEVIFSEIQQPIRFLEPGITGPHYLNMLMLMSESVMFARGVGEDKPKKKDH